MNKSNKLWWEDKTKSEKISLIIKSVLWIFGIVGLFFCMFGNMLFGDANPIFAEFGNFSSIIEWFTTSSEKFLRTGAALVITFMVIALVNLLVKFTLMKNKKTSTVGTLIKSLFKYIALIVALFVILGIWGVNTATLLASLGVVSLIIGLGCQTLINDVVSGIFLVLENTFHVGDIVVIDGFRGTVSDVGIKSTKIVDAGGNIKTINNSNIATVVNLTDALSVAIIDCDIDYSEDITRVEAIISKNLDEIKAKIPAIKEGPYYKGVATLGASGVTLRFVATCLEEDRFQVVRDLNREIKIIFDKNNVIIPFPQIVVNKPVEAVKVTKKEEKIAKEFVKEQKELSKDIDENLNEVVK